MGSWPAELILRATDPTVTVTCQKIGTATGLLLSVTVAPYNSVQYSPFLPSEHLHFKFLSASFYCGFLAWLDSEAQHFSDLHSGYRVDTVRAAILDFERCCAQGRITVHIHPGRFKFGYKSFSYKNDESRTAKELLSPMAFSTFAVGGSALVFLVAGLVWQRTCKSAPPWHAELAAMLGQPRAKKLPGTAVVCGGSIAGSVTARILADHFERVILVDPEVDKIDEPKTRILQYNAFHVFLCLFVAGARRLWPNFDAEIQAAGGRFGSTKAGLHYSGIPIIFPPSFPETMTIRRPGAQRVIQKLLMQHPTATNITVIPGTVRGFNPSGDTSSIQSVLIRKTDGTQVSLNDVALVVDCTGPTQSGLKWLKSAGFALPENLRRSYSGNMRYTTINFTVTPELEAKLPIPGLSQDTIMIYANLPHSTFGCFLVGFSRIEENTMQVLFSDSGEGDSDMPRVASDVLPYLQRFPSHEPIPAWFFEVVALLCEQGDPVFYHTKISTQSYVEYHRVPARDLPSNFIAIGDATLQLNPIHGQGFAKIMLNGIALDALLRSLNTTSLPRDFSARYFKKNATYTGGLWDGTRLQDYAYPTCHPMEGETHDTGRFIRWFAAKLLAAATQDEEVATAMWKARHFLVADSALFAPTVLWKILWTSSRF